MVGVTIAPWLSTDTASTCDHTVELKGKHDRDSKAPKGVRAGVADQQRCGDHERAREDGISEPRIRGAVDRFSADDEFSSLELAGDAVDLGWQSSEDGDRFSEVSTTVVEERFEFAFDKSVVNEKRLGRREEVEFGVETSTNPPRRRSQHGRAT